jgi:succinate dehydrogenase / fumarate reductase cytochrome b subunit
MSEAVAAPAKEAKDWSFALRKLHSLSGIVPVGAFLLFHLFENLKLTESKEGYAAAIRELWGIAPRPIFYAIEACLLLTPIAFHGLYGFWIWYTGRSNTAAYPYRRNWLYTAQRLTGLIAFAYMAVHVWQLRIMPGGHLALLRPTAADLPTFEHVQNAVTPLGWTVAYLVGGISAAFHLGNGLFGFAYSWGLAVGRKAQARVEMAGWGLFLLLSAAIVYTVVRIHFPPVS